MAAAPQTAPASSSTAQARPVSDWSLQDRLAGAINHSAAYMPAEMWDQVKAFLSPESLAIMATVTGAWAISQFFGVGEIADAVIVVGGGVMLGASALQVGHEIVSFALGAYNAKTDADLDEAGKHFAKAVVLGGITIISALFLKSKPKVMDEPYFGQSFPRPKGPGPRNGGMAYKPSTTVGPIQQPANGFIYGITNEYGDIVIEQSLSPQDKLATLYHEQVHQVLTPKLYFLRNVRIQLAMEGYNRSYLLRYLEEALAQTVAELRTKGITGLPDGIQFPVKNGYVTVAKMGKEVAGILLGPINVAGNGYRVYFTSKSAK